MTTPESITVDLEWRAIPGYEGLYEVCNLGIVRRLYKNGEKKLLKPYIRGRYFCVCLSKHDQKKNFSIARLVATTFIPNPKKKPQVNHKSGDRTDDSIWNLEWATASENTQHAVDTGLRARVQGVALQSMNGRPPWNS